MNIKAFIFLLLIISSSLFYYGFFDVMLLHSKNIATNKLTAAARNRSLKLLKVQASVQDDYSDDEIKIDGNLYDVSERKMVGDTLYLLLYHDTDEQSVLSAIGDFFKDDTTNLFSYPNHPSLKNVRILYNPQYCFNSMQFSLQTIAGKNKSFHSRIALLSSAFYDILIPPPKLS